ncbi:unnamed protein product [Clonostachys rosea]|uniref:Heterokaryon incompatibility domain-containing protein n=1 Tax=Bionectria ochroleuca TaxID=29856 RepID=A0ABY6UMA3_BIOOC|nr:unnamed protein product [Clonostachys rosea]
MSYPGYDDLNATGDDIRLLYVEALPTGQLDLLSCSMKTVALSESPPYYALSYVWGDQTQRQDILIDGHPVSVATSLASGLQGCRDRFGSDLAEVGLWADALCINQANLDEKMHQIGLMSRVYSQARCVVAWLGDESDDTADAIREIGKLSEMFTDYYEASWAMKMAIKLQETSPGLGWITRMISGTRMNPLRSNGWLKSMAEIRVKGSSATVDSLEKPNLSSRTKLALRDIVERPYWSRVWTFQEIVLAKNVLVLCGSYELPWRDLGMLGMVCRIIRNAPSRVEDLGVINELIRIFGV